MKHLIKKASNITLYHGTSIRGLEGITNDGQFTPNAITGGTINFNEQELATGNSYLATSKDVAEGYALIAAEFWAMENEENEEDILYAIIEYSMPEDLLEPDNFDGNDYKTWQESAEGNGQVQIKGSIPNSFITKVNVLDEYSKPVYSGPIDDWKKQPF